MAHSKTEKQRQRRKIIRFWLLLTLLGVMALGLLEAAVRLAMPQINHQGTALALFRERAFGDSMGWKPNAMGNAFGATVTIDESGFRKLPSPVDYRESWLILGDSVTFGVGVDAEATFIGRLQSHLPEVKLWNTAVVGYSGKDYAAVQEYFKDPKLTRVILCLCLNDIIPAPNVQFPSSGPLKRFTGWLARNSKLYLLLKNLFFDRSRRYFEGDLARYAEGSRELAEYYQTLERIQKTAAAAQLPVTVVLLPYEYQVRSKNAEALRPQKSVREFFARNQIPCLDAYPWLAESGLDSKRLFLYADAMHLSSEGHRIIYEHLAKELTSKTP
jgi:lysophospholipase L1-like esterase